MDENILIDVEFISIWDGNRIIESTASVDMDTKEVFDIEDDGSDDGDFCMERHIVIDEEESPVVPKRALLNQAIFGLTMIEKHQSSHAIQASTQQKKPEALRLGLDFFGYGCILR